MKNGELRIKVSIGALEIELEGDADTVNRQFKELKETGLGKIAPDNFDIQQPMEVVEINNNAKYDIHEPNIPGLNNSASQVSSYETLNNIIMKQLPGAETEWVLIYAFYSSDFGKSEFTRDQILLKYEETKRANSSRKSNLTNNLKTLLSRNNWIFALNYNEFRLTETGIKTAKQILSRKSPSRRRKPPTRKLNAENAEKPEKLENNYDSNKSRDFSDQSAPLFPHKH